MQIKRDDIIKYGVENKASADKIDQVLKKYGYAPYNPLIEKESWAHTSKRILPSLKEVGRDAVTFGGEVIKPIGDIINRNKTISEVVNDPTIKKGLAGAAIGGGIGSKVGPIGTLGGILLGGAIGGLGPEGFANANLSVYNTNAKDLLSGKTNWKDVVQGAQHNPAYATIDILSAGGAKALGNKIKGIGDTLPKDAPLWARQIFPNKDVRDLNRRLSDSLGSAKAKTGKNYEAYGILEGDRNIPREELVNHIRTNRSNLKGKQKLLADALVKSLRANEDLAAELNLLNDGPYNIKGTLARDNVTSQYIMQRLDPKLNLTFDEVFDFVNTGAVNGDTRLGRLIYDNKGSLNQFGKDLVKLRDEGDTLWKDRKIAFLTEKFAGQKDPLKEKIANSINGKYKNYWNTKRVIGRATAKDLAPVLDESIKFQLDQISHSKEFYDIMDDILTNTKVGRDIPIDKLPEIRLKAMSSIAEDIGKGELPDFNKALRSAGLKDYIDPVYFNTLNNVFRKPLNTGLRRVLSAFKKNVLATPHWTFLNRMGNWPNNFIEGVTLKDYFDTRKYSKYLPDQLKNQTSFSSYLNEGLEQLIDPGSLQYSGMTSSINVPLNKLKRAKGKFDASNKSLDDIWDYVSSLYANTNDLVANPIFKAESIMELTDRYANYIRQAKRVSKKLNVPVEKVLEEAKNDTRLYNKLNTEVNKSLGDYTGKMYNLPSKFYNTLSEAIPFYRFYAQTLRTTAHQLANYPFRYQAIIQSPTKIGREKAEEIKNTFGFSDDWYQGGIPYGQTADGNIRTIGYEPVPIANVLQTIGNVGQGEDVIQLMNPVISSLTPALMFQKFGKTATTPRLDEYKRSNSYEVSNFKPTIGEYARYMTASMLGATSAWYNMIQRWGREIAADATKKGLQSRYDTHPFTEIPSSYRRTLPTELTGKQFGIKTYSNYKQKPRSKSRVKRDRRSEMFFKKKEMDAKLPLKQL